MGHAKGVKSKVLRYSSLEAKGVSMKVAVIANPQNEQAPLL